MKRAREWRGSVFKPADKDRLWITVKVDGVWRKRPTPYSPGEEAKAEAFLADVREELLARAAAMRGEAGPVSVRAWSKRWLETRTSSKRADESILKNHVLPAIGDMLLADVLPRHMLELVLSWQPKDGDGNPAPGARAGRTVGNWYSTTRSMFRDAALHGLIDRTPCIVGAPHLPPREDADSEWRPTARLTKRELEQLLAPNDEIEPDSTVTYALLGLAALRHGELAALRWRHYDAEREPLGSLLIANSNRRRRTKKGKTRLMPVHPLLATILAEWRLAGWARLMERQPTDDDLVLPLPMEGRAAGNATGLRRRTSEMRSNDFTWKRADRHLKALGWRHRRVHDLRRTFVSLATAAGADDRVLYWGTHGRPGDIMGAYGDADWRRLCDEVLKLKVERTPGARLLPLRAPEASGKPVEGPAKLPTGRKQDGRGRP